MTIELVLVGNGPGELAGWVRPVGRAAREIGPTDLRLTLVLSPTQFAGGREFVVVKSWNLFDRILPPMEGIGLALGTSRFEASQQASVTHLGGDLGFSARVAKHLRVPAGAFAETLLVARRHRSFEKVFAASDDLARQLRAHGVPDGKVVVTGDPRVDAVLGGGSRSPASGPNPSPGRTPLVVSLLPGSRDRYFRVLFPYLMGVANALAAMRPRVTFQIIVSEFLSPELVTATRVKASRRWPALRPAWVTQDAWMALARSDLALTFPGTTTVELAMLGVPFAAIVPLEYLDRVPAEGILEWVGRIPAAGRMIKRVAAWWYFTRPRLTALPNLRAGRAIAPEWIGRWTPTELANRVSDLLDDEARRRTMKTELRSVYAASVGASARIAQQALALAAVPGASYP